MRRPPHGALLAATVICSVSAHAPTALADDPAGTGDAAPARREPVAALSLKTEGVNRALTRRLWRALTKGLHEHTRFELLPRRETRKKLMAGDSPVLECTSADCAKAAAILTGATHLLVGRVSRAGPDHLVELELLGGSSGERVGGIRERCPGCNARDLTKFLKITARRLDLTKPTRLSVSTEPPGADVLLDGGRVGLSPVELAVAPGSYLVTVEKAGHAGAKEMVTVGEGEVRQLALGLQAMGSLDITATPADARLDLDGRDMGPANGRFEMPVGPHVLLIHREGRLPIRERVDVPAADLSLSFDLKEASAVEPVTVTVKVEPADAEVFVDGARIVTGVPVELTAGRRRFEVRSPGHTLRREEVALAPGEPLDISFSLKRLPAQVMFRSQPAGAMVYLDSAFRGRTDLPLELPDGDHLIELRRGGVALFRQKIAVGPGERREYDFFLQPLHSDALTLVGETNPMVTWGWVATGVGASLALAGGGIALIGSSQASACEGATGCDPTFSSDGAPLGAILIGAGVAVLGGGVAMLLLAE